MGRKILAAAGVLVLALAFTVSVQATSVTLRGEKYPDMSGKTPTSVYYPSLNKLLDVKTEAPSGWDIPKGVRQPLYAVFPLGDSDQLLILDKKSAGDQYPTVLYFDRNGEGKLARAQPVLGETDSDRYRTIIKFPPIDAKIKVDGKPVVYSFRVEMTCYNPSVSGGDDRQYVRLYTNCCYTGTLDLFGKKFRVLLADGNVNGRFGDKPPAPDKKAPAGGVREADRIYLAPTGTRMDDRNGTMMGDLMLFKDKTFKVNVDIPGKKLELTECTKEMGTVKLPMPVTFMSLYGENEKSTLVVVAPSQKVRIPRDTYSILEYRVICKDQQGDSWFLSANGTAETPTLTVGKDEVAASFGQPFLPTADVEKTGSAVRLSFKLVGSAKEVVQEILHIEGKSTKIPMASSAANRPKEATYTIATAAGKVAAQGSFHYG